MSEAKVFSCDKCKKEERVADNLFFGTSCYEHPAGWFVFLVEKKSPTDVIRCGIEVRHHACSIECAHELRKDMALRSRGGAFVFTEMP